MRVHPENRTENSRAAVAPSRDPTNNRSRAVPGRIWSMLDGPGCNPR